MTVTSALEIRQGELWRRLEGVNDPELDEPVTEMGFIERAEIAGDGSVDVGFRLPTYWCSPNFAFLMLEDVKTALEALSWSPDFQITLHDHMFADEVNGGVANGKGFAEIFGALSDAADLGDLREKFRRKAFMRRQEAVILDFRGIGIADSEIVQMTVSMFDAVRAGTEQSRLQKLRYRQALLQRWPDLRAGDHAIIDLQGQPILPQGLPAHVADLRSVRINMEFNGALCRGLKQTRYKELEMVDGEPTLVDFILDRVKVQPPVSQTPAS